MTDKLCRVASFASTGKLKWWYQLVKNDWHDRDTLAVMHGGDEITTIEGIGQPGSLHPVQSAFVAHDGYQCGYCTCGQIMSAVALLKEPSGPKDDDVREAMSGNICRCGAYLPRDQAS